jgi:hypothetical protein
MGRKEPFLGTVRALIQLRSAGLALALLMAQACVTVEEAPARRTPVAVQPAATVATARPSPTLRPAATATRISPTRTPTPDAVDDTAIEQSVADARASLERVLRGAALPGLEDILLETVALAAPSGGEQLTRPAAARWLRQRATGRIRVRDLQRHQHQALITTTTEGWAPVAPETTGELGFTLRRYDAGGSQDPEHGSWLIDVIEAE